MRSEPQNLETGIAISPAPGLAGEVDEQKRREWAAREADAGGRQAEVAGSASEARAAERRWVGGG